MLSSKIRNKGMMFALTTSIQDCVKIIASAVGGEKGNSKAPKLEFTKKASETNK